MRRERERERAEGRTASEEEVATRGSSKADFVDADSMKSRVIRRQTASVCSPRVPKGDPNDDVSCYLNSVYLIEVNSDARVG